MKNVGIVLRREARHVEVRLEDREGKTA